jgi:hypothetical protein
MNRDDDTFYEDDDYDEEDEDEFPDEEYEEDEEDDYDSTELLDEPHEPKLAKFIEDPWPPTTFILVIIGLGIVLLTPPFFWSLWNYFIIADYFMIIISGAAIAYSLVTWSRAGKHRLRWAALTNLIVIIAVATLATIDTFSWIINLHSIFPGVQTPILSLALVLAVFSIYSLWVIQRNFAQPKR